MYIQKYKKIKPVDDGFLKAGFNNYIYIIKSIPSSNFSTQFTSTNKLFNNGGN